jgi:DNA-binding XRE family transcriptional regulator/tetratricopeptide (TPR) repeat protein
MTSSDRPAWAWALRDLRLRHALSQEGMAEQVEVDRVTVARWERGRNRPQPSQIRRICDTFAVSAEQLRLVPSDPMKRRDFTRGLVGAGMMVALAPFDRAGSAASGGPLVGDMAELEDVHPIEHLSRVRAVLVDSDNLLGPRPVIPTVVRYIGLIQRLRERHGGTDGQALLHMKARYAEFAGWLYQDAGDLAAAQHWLDRALDWSHGVGDHEMATYILSRKSQLAGDMEEGFAAVDLAAAAWNLAPDRHLKALSRTYAAHGHALARRPMESLHALDEARSLVLDAGTFPPGGWAPWLDVAYIDVQRARCLTILGDPLQAASLFQDAIRQLPPSFRRDRGVYLGREALAHASSREPEEAAAVGVRALAIALETQSGRIVAELERLDEALEGWKSVPAVGAFRDQMGQLRRQPE